MALKFRWPVFASFWWFLLCYYINCVLQVTTDQNQPKAMPPLPDRGHDLLPFYNYENFNNIWLLVMAGLTALRFAFTKIGLTVLRRYFIVQGIVFLLRAVSISITNLSVPLRPCESSATGNPWIEGWAVMVVVHQTCGDVFFSGHTAAMTLFALCWTTYSRGEEWNKCIPPHKRSKTMSTLLEPEYDAVGDPQSCHLTPVIAWAFAFVGYFFIIATHYHYSADVWVAFWITILTFKLYHYYIKSLPEKNSHLSKAILWVEELRLPSSSSHPVNVFVPSFPSPYDPTKIRLTHEHDTHSSSKTDIAIDEHEPAIIDIPESSSSSSGAADHQNNITIISSDEAPYVRNNGAIDHDASFHVAITTTEHSSTGADADTDRIDVKNDSEKIDSSYVPPAARIPESFDEQVTGTDKNPPAA